MLRSILLLLTSSLCWFGLAADGDVVRQTCGFDPLRHRVMHGVTGRGVNDFSGQAPVWVNVNNVFPTPPDQKTIVTYSFVTATETYSGETLNPIATSSFIGANTLAVIAEGVESWNDTAGIKLVQVSTNGQIRIGQFALAGSQVGLGGFGAASNGGRFYMTDGFVQLDNTDGNWTAPVLRAVSAHEMGHALGLLHTSDTTALMNPSVNSSTGPHADDRYYMQFLYGSARAKVSGTASQSSPVSLNIGRASPKQTGTNSTPTFEGGLNITTGTGSLTQNDVSKYIVDRKGPGEAGFSTLNASVTATTGGQNADGELSHTANSFAFSDASTSVTGTYTYRVTAVHLTGQTTTNDTASDTFDVNVTTTGSGGGGGGGGGNGTTPAVTSTLSAQGQVGQAFTYTATATGNPTPTLSFLSAPSGLVANGATLSGIPTTPGFFVVTIQATNSAGNITADLALNILAANGGGQPVATNTGALSVKVGESLANKFSKSLTKPSDATKGKVSISATLGMDGVDITTLPTTTTLLLNCGNFSFFGTFSDDLKYAPGKKSLKLTKLGTLSATKEGTVASAQIKLDTKKNIATVKIAAVVSNLESDVSSISAKKHLYETANKITGSISDSVSLVIDLGAAAADVTFTLNGTTKSTTKTTNGIDSGSSTIKTAGTGSAAKGP